MIIKDGELYRINLKLRELAIKENNKEITEKEYKEQEEPLRKMAYELTQKYIKGEKEKMYPKREPDKKTVGTKLSRFWGFSTAT